MSERNGRQPTDFGKLVKRYREARSYSQEHLEQLAGIPPGTGYISQVETGQRGVRPGRDRVLAIAQALRAPAREFLVAAGRLDPGDSLAPDERMTFRAFVETDPLLRSDQKKILVELYESWVGKSV